MEASENAGIVFHRRRIKNQWHFHTKNPHCGVLENKVPRESKI